METETAGPAFRTDPPGRRSRFWPRCSCPYCAHEITPTFFLRHDHGLAFDAFACRRLRPVRANTRWPGNERQTQNSFDHEVARERVLQHDGRWSEKAPGRQLG